MRLVIVACLLAAPCGAQLDFELATYRLDAEPTALDVADFDGDGLSDIICAHEAADQVSIALQRPGRAFGLPVSLDVGDGPRAVVAGHLDADATLDLAVLHGGQRTEVWILLGTGPTSFALHTAFPTAADPQALCAGDLGSDGHLDLVVACGDSHVLQVFTGSGDGTFGAPSDIPSDNLTSLDLADASGDGHLDAAAGTTDTDAVLFEGGPSGGLTQVATAYTGLDDVARAAFGDVDGDGMQDLVTAGVYYGIYDENDVSINTGFPSFAFQEILYGGSGFELADVDGDGRDDVATHHTEQPRLMVWRDWIPGTSGFYAAHEPFADRGALGAPRKALDLDGDGRTDVATGFKGDGQGSFSVHWQRLPLPPAIDPSTPAELPSLVADTTGFLVRGAGFTAVNHVALDATVLGWLKPGAKGTVEILDDRLLRLTPAPAAALGPLTLLVAGVFGGASLPLSVVAPAAPVLNAFDADGQVSWYGFPPLHVGGKLGDLAFVAVSLALEPTVLPGILAADIGAQGASLLVLQAVTLAIPGWSSLPISFAGSAGGVTIHFQAAAIDSLTLEFPFQTSNVVSLTVY